MPVIDTSAVIATLTADPPAPDLVVRVSRGDLHAPHLIDVEFTHALRRLLATGRLSLERASGARQDFVDLPIVRYPHGPLLDRMWDLRDNLSSYDAAFVALSEVLEMPLLTADARLAGAPGNHALMEVYRAIE